MVSDEKFLQLTLTSDYGARLNVTTVPFEIKFTRPFLLQGFRLFCYQFVE